ARRVPRGRQFTSMRLGFFLGGFPGQFGMSMGVDGEIDRHPELFLLLSQEALREGFRVSDDLVNTIVTNSFPPTSREEELKEAVRKTLLIGLLHDRMASSVKISQPIILHENAPNWQSVRL